ncbi:MAG: SPOR domain-containing protein [Acidiferrobacterales bacterium]
MRAANAPAQLSRQAGYAVKAKTTQLHNRTIHRLRVENFDSKAQAEGFAKRIADQFRIAHPWVTCPAVTSCR